MFERLYPKEWADSTYNIDFERFYEEGFRGIIIDIDNTLVPHGADADARAIELFKRLKDIGYDVCLLSNNKKARVKRFNKDVNVNYIFKDIYGGNLAGIYTILVNPINKHEEIQIVLKRLLEKFVLHFYKKKLKAEHKSWPGRKFTG